MYGKACCTVSSSHCLLYSRLLAQLCDSSKRGRARYIIEHEKDLALNQQGPHDGGGNTTAYSYFSNDKKCNMVFRKRVLHPGSSIGYHLQQANEIYYIVSGTGSMKMNNTIFEVHAGDAILTYPGSSHGLSPSGSEDLVVIINYLKTQ